MGANNYFKPGGWNATCGECGDWWKSNQLRQRWDGIWACKFCWEPQHPQDFLRGVKDEQAVPKSQPDPAPIFIVYP
jgi:hypothetical protein